MFASVPKRPWQGWLLLVWVVVACSAPASFTPPAPVATIPIHLWIGVTDGAATLIPFIKNNFVSEGVVLQFVVGNGRTLRDDLASGQLDLVLSHHVPADSSLWFTPVLLDGVVLIVNPSNPIRALTQAEGQAVFGGRITNWKEVGGRDGPIHLHIRELGADERTVLGSRLMAEERFSITAVTQPSPNAMLAAVAADEAAIGYTMLGMLMAEVTPLTLNGVVPSPTTLGTQEYLLTTPLYALSDGEPRGAARALVAWLQAVETQTRLGERYGRVR